jgi:hypothetical protein
MAFEQGCNDDSPIKLMETKHSRRISALSDRFALLAGDERDEARGGHESPDKAKTSIFTIFTVREAGSEEVNHHNRCFSQTALGGLRGDRV